MKFSIKNLFSKFYRIRRFLRIYPHLLKESLMKNFIFCAVLTEQKRGPSPVYNPEYLCIDNKFILFLSQQIIFLI